MSWSSWFHKRSTSRKNPPRKTRLGFETLEERATPALATALVSVALPTIAGNSASFTTTSAGNSFSADENLFVFASDAANLVAGDTNGSTDIFVANLATGVITRVSTTAANAQADGPSIAPTISADGRYVAFQSRATNLVAGDTNGTDDIFVKDLQTGTVTLISASAAGVLSNNLSYQPAISADGQFVVFSSLATNLSADDADATQDVYRKNRSTGAIDVVSRSADGVKGNQLSGTPAISSDGRYIAFASDATNLLPGGADTNAKRDVFRKDLTTGAVALVSSSAAGVIGNNDSSLPAISADGNVVAFVSNSSNLVSADGNSKTDIFVKNLTTAGVVRVSVANDGAELNDNSVNISISADGTKVAFSTAAAVIAGDTNSAIDVYLRDTTANTTTRVTTLAGGAQAVLGGDGGVLSPTGAKVGFASLSPDYNANDTNGLFDVFVKNRTTGAVALVTQGGAAFVGGDGHSFLNPSAPQISGDGNSVLFVSAAGNLVSGGDTNGDNLDLYLRRLSTLETVRISSSGTGSQGNGTSTSGGFVPNADSNTVAFSSNSTNLVTGDTQNFSQIYLKNPTTGFVLAVSRTAGGIFANGNSVSPVLSANGQYVAFITLATNLFSDTTPTAPDVVVLDLNTGAFTLVSATSAGAQVAGDIGGVSMSDDGQYIAFSTNAPLDPADTNGVADVYVKNRTTGALTLVSRNSSTGTVGNGASDSPVLSGDGKYIVFATAANNLIANDINNSVDVFRSEWQAGANGTLALVSARSDAIQANNHSTSPSISADGRFVAFDSQATNLVANDANNVSDIFIKDMSTGAVYLASQNVLLAQGNGASSTPSISRDGRGVAYVSVSTNLVAIETSSRQNIFMTVVNQAPTASITGATTINTGQSLTLSLTATDAENETLSYSWDLNGDGVFGDATGASINLSSSQLAALGLNVAGTFPAKVRITDAYGPIVFNVPITVVDTSGPLASITPGTVGTNEGQTASFAGSATGNGTITLAWSATRNGVAVASGTGSSFTFNLTDNGSYVVTLTATDPDNKVGTATSSFTVNNVVPTITSLNAPATGVEGTAISFTPTATDAGQSDQQAGFTFIWTVTKDGAAFSSGTANTVSFTPTDNGSYVVSVTARDKDNGVSAASTATITVVNVAPNLNIAPTATVAEGAVYTLPLAATDPGTDTISEWSINWGDGTPVQTFAGNVTSATHTYADGLATRTITVVATDEDNIYTATQTLTVTDVAPTATVTGSATAVLNAIYDLAIGALVDPGADTVSSAVINWGDSTTTPIVNFNTNYQHTYTAAGVYPLSVTVTNEDGTFTLASFNVSAGGSLPTTNITGAATIAEGALYTLTVDPISNPASLPITGYRINWGDGTVADFSGTPPATLTHTFADNAPTRTITLTLLNGTTAYDLPATRTISVTDVAPTATLTAPNTTPEGSSITLSIGAIVDPGADVVSSWVVAWGDGQTSTGNGAVPATLTHTYTQNADIRVITLSVTNEEGTFTAGTTSLVVTNVAPTFDAGVNADLFEGGTFTRALSFTDPGADNWTVTVNYGDNSSQQLTLNGKSFNLEHVYTQQGSYTVTVTINDGTTTTTDSFVVAVANVLPTVSAGADATLGLGGTFTRTGSFTDPGADTWTGTVNYGDNTPVQTLVISNKTFQLNHTYAQKGQYAVVVTINDGTGSATDTVIVSVALDNGVPVIALPTTATLAEGGTLTTAGSFTDPDADTWTGTVDYGLGQGTVPLTITNKTFALNKVYPQNGVFTVVVTINDGVSTATATMTLTVTNVQPIVDAGANATVVAGTPFTRSGSFTDPGADTWTASVNYGDGGGSVSLPLTNKTFTLNHTYTTTGTFPVVVTINDGNGTPATATFNVTVTAIPLTLSANRVVEKSPTSTPVGTVSTGVSATDSAAAFTLVDDAGGRFSLSGRQLVVANGTLLDRAVATSHVVRIRVVHNGATSEQNFTIEVRVPDNGDDFVGRDPVTGAILVARSTGTQFVTTNYQAVFNPAKTWVDILVADFDGNGDDDVVGRDAATGQWWLAKNTGSAFELGLFTTWSRSTWVDVMAVDLNGDGKADLLGRNETTGDWIAAFSAGATAASEVVGKWNPKTTWTSVRVADVNNDSRVDVIGVQAGTGKFFASINQTNGTGKAKLVNQLSPWVTLSDGNLASRTTWVDVQMADIDGDGRLDYLGRVQKTAQWYVAYGTAGKPQPSRFLSAWNRNIAYAPTLIGDMNGDGKADLIGRVQSSGQWIVGLAPATRGVIPAPVSKGPAGFFYSSVFLGDFNGDGKVDLAGIRTGTNTWTVGLSTGVDFDFTNWGSAGNLRLSIRKGRIAS